MIPGHHQYSATTSTNPTTVRVVHRLFGPRDHDVSVSDRGVNSSTALGKYH